MPGNEYEPFAGEYRMPGPLSASHPLDGDRIRQASAYMAPPDLINERLPKSLWELAIACLSAMPRLVFWIPCFA